MSNSLRYPQEMKTAWILTRTPVYPADLLFRRFGGGECYKAWFGESYGLICLQVVKAANTPQTP